MFKKYNYKDDKVKVILIAISIIIVCISIFAAFVLKDNRIYSGIYIDGVDVSGLEINMAIEKLNDAIDRMIPIKKEVIEYDGNVWEYSFENLGIGFNTEEAVKKAYGIGRSGNIFYRLYSIIKTRINKHKIYLEVYFDRDLMLEALKNIKQQVDRQEKNAEVRFLDNKISFVKHETGKRLNINKNLDNWTAKLHYKDFKTLSLIVDEIEPEIKESDIKHIESIIGKFSTKFNQGDADRSYNIKLASSKINGILLMPGQEFSMNKSLGPRTSENGYKEAPVILKNELVKSTGGGVCQVTTTLYNAVLLSKLKIVERQHHSMPLGYVEMGRDATIAENYIDFKFRNSNGYPIAIFSSVKDNVISVYILGKHREAGMNVVLKSQVVEKYEPQGEEIEYSDEIPENERIVVREPKNGYKVLLYRETYSADGVLLLREKISEDIYAPVKAKVKVGRKIT